MNNAEAHVCTKYDKAGLYELSRRGSHEKASFVSSNTTAIPGELPVAGPSDWDRERTPLSFSYTKKGSYYSRHRHGLTGKDAVPCSGA